MSENTCDRTTECHRYWSLLRDDEVTNQETDKLLARMPDNDHEPIAETEGLGLTATAVGLNYLAHGDPEVNPWDAVAAYDRHELQAMCSLPRFQLSRCGVMCPLLGIQPPQNK